MSIRKFAELTSDEALWCSAHPITFDKYRVFLPLGQSSNHRMIAFLWFAHLTYWLPKMFINLKLIQVYEYCHIILVSFH